jgi:hypothetical protein
MMSGEMHRVLSSGDISVTEVTVPVHRHKGHSIAVKVRPAFSYYPMHHPVIFGGQRGLDYSRSANKAQPFDSGVDYPELITRPNEDDINNMEAVVSRRGILGLENDVDETQGLAFPTSKVRAFLPELRSGDDHHQFYSHKLKVKPYTGTDDERVSYQHHTEERHQYPLVDIGSEQLTIMDNDQFPNHGNLEGTLPKRDVEDFGTVLSYNNRGSRIGNEAEYQVHGAGSPYEGRKYSASEHPLIHSPIPVSKIRPIFTGQPSSSGHESHSSASKVGPIQRGPSVAATQDKSYFQMESGQSLHS